MGSAAESLRVLGIKQAAEIARLRNVVERYQDRDASQLRHREIQARSTSASMRRVDMAPVSHAPCAAPSFSVPADVHLDQNLRMFL